jgi:hypothetical protein
VISAGYYVALWKGEPWSGHGLSVSDCLSFLAPDWWGLGWTTTAPGADPLVEASRFGIAREVLPEVQAWSSALHDHGGFRVHHTFVTAAHAMEFCKRFVKAPARVLGVALPPDAASLLTSEYAEEYRDFQPGPYSCLSEGRIPDAGGTSRGFEILGYVSTGQFESARCNALESDFKAHFGVTPNGFGLVQDADDALRCAEYANGLDTTCAELWLPGLISEYWSGDTAPSASEPSHREHP